MEKFVSYIRISKESKSGLKEGRHLGLEAQRSIISHYYTNIIQEFSEIRSAKNITDRVELQRAIAYCKEHGATLVVAKVDRLSRCVEDCLSIYKELNKRVRSCDIPGEIDKFTLTMYSAFAERERELISIRTTQAIKAKKERGETWTVKYKPETLDGTYLAKAREQQQLNARMNPNTIRATDVVNDKRNMGWTLERIANHLNLKGYYTPRGKEFTKTQVLRIIERLAA